MQNRPESGQKSGTDGQEHSITRVDLIFIWKTTERNLVPDRTQLAAGSRHHPAQRDWEARRYTVAAGILPASQRDFQSCDPLAVARVPDKSRTTRWNFYRLTTMIIPGKVA